MLNEDKDWIDYCNKFANNYDSFNYDKSLQSHVMRAGHKFLEKIYYNSYFKRVVEIGCGTGEHFNFVGHKFDEYIMTDHHKGALECAKERFSSKFQENEGKLYFERQSGDKLTYKDSSFDRLVAVHLLEHIYYPHIAIKEWVRVLKNGGVLSILIPTDPGIAWRLGRCLGPRRNVMRKGLPYDYIMAREHVNSCNNLVALLRYYFPNSTENWWPLRIPSIDLNLLFVFHGIIKKDE